MTTNTDLHGAMPELPAACPFCEHSMMHMRSVGQMQQAHCSGCGAAGPLFTDAGPAIAVWNRRAAIQQAAGAVPEVPFAWYSAKVDDVITDAKKQGRLLVQPWDAKHYDKPLYAASPAPPKQQPALGRGEVGGVRLSKPVEYQTRMRPGWLPHGEGWSEWAKCSEGVYLDHRRAPLLHGWQYEARALYSWPAVALAYEMRELLLRYRTETPIGHQPHMIAGEVDAVLEAAHGIGNAPRPSAPTGQINPDSAGQGMEGGE